MKHAAPAEGVFVLPRGKGFSFAQRVLAVRLFALILGTILLAWFFNQVANRDPESVATTNEEVLYSSQGVIHTFFLAFGQSLGNLSWTDVVQLLTYLTVALVMIFGLFMPALKLDRLIRRKHRS